MDVFTLQYLKRRIYSTRSHMKYYSYTIICYYYYYYYITLYYYECFNENCLQYRKASGC